MKEIPFRIKKIENSQVEMFPDLVDSSISEFTVDSGFAFNGNLDPAWVGCQSEFTFRQGDTRLAHFIAYCYFEIDPNFVKREAKEGVLVIDKEFLRYLATITVGTARGIFHAKTQNTILHQFVLPPINLMTLDIQDMEVK